MNWSEPARVAMKETPAFLQPMLKMKVEKEAAAQKLSEITPEFLKQVQEELEALHQKKLEQDRARTLDSFFANTDRQPIYAGFKNTVSVHAGLSGTPVTEMAGLWPEVAALTEETPRRALYIHTPFCVARCKFCSFYNSRTRAEELDKYTGYLLKELEMVAESHYARSLPFDAVYFGGGTPTDMSAASIRRILSHLQTHWNLADDCEITFEGRIHGFTDEKVTACLDHGVNRFSFGVQSFNSRIRRQMGRIDKREVLLKRIGEIAACRPGTISVDLIYGLPDQTRALWQEDITTALETEGIDSCSIYNLKFLPGSPIKSLVERGKMSVPASLEEQADLYRFTRRYLGERQVIRSGLRHWSFGKRDRNIYNFIPKYGYGCLPIGSSAGGKIGPYSVFQCRNVKDYYACLERNEKPLEMALKTDQDSVFAGAIVGSLEEFLRVDLREIARLYQLPDLMERYQPLLEQWQQAGMINFDFDSGVVELTEAGEFHNVNLAQNLIEFNAWSLNES